MKETEPIEKLGEVNSSLRDPGEPIHTSGKLMKSAHCLRCTCMSASARSHLQPLP